jgi:hypothetical protein
MPENPQRWLILTSRYGKEIENPSQDDLNHAIDELKNDNPKKNAGTDDSDHEAAWLSSEAGDGPKFILSVERDGTTCFSKFTSQDADDPSEEITKKISLEKALALWMLLAKGNTAKIEAELADDHSVGLK